MASDDDQKADRGVRRWVAKRRNRTTRSNWISFLKRSTHVVETRQFLLPCVLMRAERASWPDSPVDSTGLRAF